LFHLNNAISPFLCLGHHRVILKRVASGVITGLVRVECKNPFADSLTLFINK
jgi:hypothetical protein